MAFDANVTVGGIGITGIGGVTINYGYNTIPSAIIDVDPVKNAGILENVEQYRREPMTVNIQTKVGNMTFSGLFDGASFNQTPGDLAFQIVAKSVYQSLKEIYPKVPGLVPASTPIFNRVQVIFATENPQNPDDTIKSLLGNNAAVTNNPVIGYIKLLVQILQQQLTGVFPQITTGPSSGTAVSSLYDILQDPKYIANVNNGIALLNNIDTSAVAGYSSKLGTNSVTLTKGLIDILVNSADTLWDALLTGLQYLNCNLLIANTKAFVVPNNQFIKFGDNSAAGASELSGVANLAYPAGYNLLGFNDNGYIDIGHAYVLTDNSAYQMTNVSGTGNSLGGYSDPTSKGTGVLVVAAPAFLALADSADLDALDNASGGSDGSYNSNNTMQTLLTSTSTSQLSSAQTQHDAFVSTVNNRLTYVGAYAQLKYLQAKYEDRTGAINMLFNPSWVPGTSGSAYTRYPGLSVNFFVTGVCHRLSESAPNTGSMITTVNYSCGRIGTNPAGFSNDTLYGYGQGQMTAVQTGFIGDIS